MEGVDGHLAVIRAKPYHKPPKNEFHANFYDILLLEINNGEVGRGLKGLPQVSIPYHEDPREKVLDCLYMLTGADRGGVRGSFCLEYISCAISSNYCIRLIFLCFCISSFTSRLCTSEWQWTFSES